MDKIKKLLNFGIIIIDKPSGPTSFSVSDFVRKSLKINKTSHFGTLDPQVTGVLPIALGRACRLTGFFLGHNKTYVGIIRVHKKISLEKLQGLINKNFLGKIMQLPPKKSRVKRAIREREIISFELLEKEGNDFLFITEVQGGTYIRKLCSDLGDLIGGAHMLELRRTKAGIFSEKQIVNLYDLEKAVQEHKNGDSKLLEKIIIPAEKAIKEIMDFVQVKPESLKKILTGKPLEKTDLKTIPKQDLFAVFNKEEFLEIAEKIPNDSFFARPKFVLN
jgi:H/ACA ribonucleoprotein complex subunit 4